jgi:hypothetical protein
VDFGSTRVAIDLGLKLFTFGIHVIDFFCNLLVVLQRTTCGTPASPGRVGPAAEWGEPPSEHMGQGCQMVYFHTKIPIWVNLGGPWNGNCCYALWPFGKFYNHLVHLV